MKVTQRTCIKNLNTLTFHVEETEVDIPITLKINGDIDIKNSPYLQHIEQNNIMCAMEVQKLLSNGWNYGTPYTPKSKRNRNFIKNCKKRLGI